MIAPQPEFYPEYEIEVWILFDFRISGTGSRMRREKYVWKHCASVERLDQNHAVLSIRPGSARRLEA